MADNANSFTAPKHPQSKLDKFAEQKRKREAEALEQAKKPRARRNSPVIGDGGMMTEPGDNSKFIQHTMRIIEMPAIDIRELEQVSPRIQDYFQLCIEFDMKPTASGLALSLGIDRKQIWSIRNDKPNALRLPPSVIEVIKKAYFFLENMWENYMQNGKINPMAGVFLGVNNYGYQDVKQVQIAPVEVSPLGEPVDAEALASRYQMNLAPSAYEALTDGEADTIE